MVEFAEDAPKELIDNGLEDIARDALDCIETVADGAEEELRRHQGGRPDSFAAVNTWTSGAQVGNLRSISENQRATLYEIIRQPVVARVEVLDDEGNSETVFITRSTPPSVPGFRIASYRSPLGRIASKAVGEDLSIRIGGLERDVEVLNTARLKPQKINNNWDSTDTEVDLGAQGRFTVVSLRELISPVGDVGAADAWDAWEHQDVEVNVLEGIRRAVISHMGLRDQPILDQHQDEIFRLPLNTKCFLSGPPGTGKTTTLIRRLGQKIDLDDSEALLAQERELVERVSVETGIDHRTSWLMFSPTELLRQYVKEAFAREGFAASDYHIHTWDSYRDAIARDDLRLLRTSTGGGPFQKRDNDSYLDLPQVTNDPADWFDDFDAFFRDDLFSDLVADASWLAKHRDPVLARIGGQIKIALTDAGAGRLISLFHAEVEGSRLEGIGDYLEQSRIDAQKIVTRTLNRLVQNDGNLPAALKKEIERQLTIAALEDGEDLDSEADDLDEEAREGAGRIVSREEVKRRYTQAVSALARARARSAKVQANSFNGRMLAWLGEERVPDHAELKELSDIVSRQSRLRKFAGFDRLVLRSIASKYRKFRVQRQADGKWYQSLPSRTSDVSWQELDLLVLFSLRTAGDLVSAYRRVPGGDLPSAGTLGAVRALHKNQILVDEATDFSVLQLASMYELSHPLTRSFFICGDLNQRLTGWGIKSDEEINWIAAGIDRRRITVSYRQSGHLVRLAKAVAALRGAEPDEIVLPDRVDVEGVAPVWKDKLSSDADIADWLSDRIREIEVMVGKVPTIAVLVNDELDVEPLAAALNERLQEINLSAAACKDGKVVGNDRDVRVFNIQHIKGLEFEAVFFTGLDKTIASHPDLFTQYLYVGATRAATYLGVSFDGVCPENLITLSDHFSERWALS